MALPVWSGWLLSGLFGVTLLACVARWRALGDSRTASACGHDDRWGAASHALMAAAMAVMLAPMPGPVPRPVWGALFALAALAFAVRAVRGAAPTDADAARRRSVRLHHVVASLGMLLMATLPGHGAGHPHTAAAPGMAGTLTVTLASGLGLYFVLRACWLVREVVVAAAPQPSGAGGAATAHFALRPRVVASCELPMCAAMGYLMVTVAG